MPGPYPSAAPPCAHDPFEEDLAPAELLRIEIVDPDLLEWMHLEHETEPADPLDLHRADVDVPGAVVLEVDERVGNAKGYLVA